MSITVTTDVFCDICSCWIHGISGIQQIDIRRSLKIAKTKGWIRKKVEGKLIDVCPDCQEEDKYVRSLKGEG